jgi:hypothetical protein
MDSSAMEANMAMEWRLTLIEQSGAQDNSNSAKRMDFSSSRRKRRIIKVYFCMDCTMATEN